ncbi:MAG: hypothetical protein ACYCPS_04265 [Candidatus Saccharimonadales bacterium]
MASNHEHLGGPRPPRVETMEVDLSTTDFRRLALAATICQHSSEIYQALQQLFPVYDAEDFAAYLKLPPVSSLLPIRLAVNHPSLPRFGVMFEPLSIKDNVIFGDVFNDTSEEGPLSDLYRQYEETGIVQDETLWGLFAQVEELRTFGTLAERDTDRFQLSIVTVESSAFQGDLRQASLNRVLSLLTPTSTS